MKTNKNNVSYAMIIKLVFIVKIHLFVGNAILKKDGIQKLMMMESALVKMGINNIKMLV
jgi:hypothetical protein